MKYVSFKERYSVYFQILCQERMFLSFTQICTFIRSALVE